MNIGDLNLYELVNMVGIPFVEVEETLGYYRIPTLWREGKNYCGVRGCDLSLYDK